MKVKCINANGYEGEGLVNGQIYTVEKASSLGSYKLKELKENGWVYKHRFEVVTSETEENNISLTNKIKRIECFLEHKKFEQNFDRTPSLGGVIKGLEIALAILEDDK
ncbi:hypothetical protein UT300012_31850 [Paraclostridium bifermentans]